VRTRQPLSRALVSAPGWAVLPDDLRQQVADELNVQTVEALADESAGLVDVTVKANFRSLGQRFAKQTPLVASAIAAANAQQVVAALRSAGTVTVDVDGIGAVEIGEDDVVVTETPREGWAVVTEGGESLALDLHVDDDLRRAGLAREIVRTLQEGRKTAGLEVSDRIAVTWSSGDDDLAAAIREHAAAIAAEVLAVDFAEAESTDAGVRVETDLPVTLCIQRT
jgi:isoleucyl-tRNA synthetase